MEKNTRIKFDALKQMHDKYINTFTLNVVADQLYDSFDDEIAVRNELIQMDKNHDKDINGTLISNQYDDVTLKPTKGKKRVLTPKGEKSLVKLTNQDNKEIEENSNK